MSRRFTIFVGNDGWRVAAVDDMRTSVIPVVTEGEPTDGRAEATAQRLAELGYAGEPTMLAVASPWCLCAVISTVNLDRGQRRRAMVFRLEEQLPISAEEFVADFVESSADEALGVCAEHSRLAEIIVALESKGVAVRHVVPEALLSAGHAVALHADADGVLIASRATGGAASQCFFELVEIRKSRPSRWWWLADNLVAVRERLTAWNESKNELSTLAVIGRDDAVIEGAEPAKGLRRVALDSANPDQVAAMEAAKVLDGVTAPWIDLRRDGLAACGFRNAYAKPVRALALSAVLLLACVVGATQWRGQEYDALAKQYCRQQVDVFRDALPEQRRIPPAGSVKGRLASERRKLAELGGQASDDVTAEVMRPVLAMDQLSSILANLPTEVRFRILDLRIQPDLVRIDGQAIDHIQAEQVAVALRRSGLYEVEPPKTRALREAGVSFLLTARPQARAAAVAAGGER